MLQRSVQEFVRELNSLGHVAITSRSPELLLKSLAEGCWIYGAGGYGRTVKRLLERIGVHVKGFIDQRAMDNVFVQALDTTVSRAEDLTVGEASASALVIGLHNFAVDQKPIVAWALQMGFRDILMPAELVDLLGQDAGSYWMTDRSHVVDSLEHLEELLLSLADDQSREVVTSLARFRATGRPELHPTSYLDDQYFPNDLPPLNGPVTLLDGGAFTGDTHAAALRHNVQVEEWIAFEPDQRNFQGLARYCANSEVSRSVLFPCGLGDACRTIRFAGDAGAGSREASDAEENATTVHVVAADQVLKGYRPTFVKLDVEGHERQALDGMRCLVEQNRPRLAISVYHKPADLWEIPAKVARMMPGTRLYIRQHGFSGFDTVLYALND